MVLASFARGLMSKERRLTLGLAKATDPADPGQPREEIHCGNCGLIYQQWTDLPESGRLWFMGCPRCSTVPSGEAQEPAPNGPART